MSGDGAAGLSASEGGGAGSGEESGRGEWMMGNRSIGASGNRDIEKLNLTTEAQKHGENQEIKNTISALDLTSSDTPLSSFMSSAVSHFSVLPIIVFGVSA